LSFPLFYKQNIEGQMPVSILLPSSALMQSKFNSFIAQNMWITEEYVKCLHTKMFN